MNNPALSHINKRLRAVFLYTYKKSGRLIPRFYQIYKIV
jgi:hypothetical protein